MLSCRAMYSYSYMCMKIYDSSCTPQEHLPSSQRVHQVTASAREQNWCQACVMHSSPRKEDTGASLSSKEREAWQLVVCLSFVGWQSYLLHVRIHVHATRESVVCLCCRWPRSRSEFFLFFFGLQGNCPPSAGWQRYRTNLVCARTAAQQHCVQAISPWQAIPMGQAKRLGP